MKISKTQLKQIIMREFRNLNETGKKRDGESKGDKGKRKHRDEEDYEDGGDRKGDEGAGKDKKDKPDYTTDARKGDKGKGKAKKDKGDYTTGARKGDKGKGKHKNQKDYSHGGDRKGDKSPDHKWRDYQKNEARLRRLREDSSEEEEAHDDADIDRLRRIRDDLNDHIRNLEDQHDRAKRHGERDD